MNTQPEALRLANELDAYHTAARHKEAAAELRRLHNEVSDLKQALDIADAVFKERDRLDEANQAMLEVLKDLMDGTGDMTYKRIEKARAAIAKATGE